MEKWTEMAPAPPPLAEGKKWHVFLSYRSVNRPWVINLYDVLRNHGFEVFLDQVVVKPGDPLVRSLQDNMAASQSAILIWSAQAARSVWVEAEFDMMAQLAQEGEFRFVPVMLDREKLPLWARRFVSVGFEHYPDGPNGGELLRLLHAVAGRSMSAEAARFASEQDEKARTMHARVRAAIDAGNAAFLRDEPAKADLVWATSSALGCAAAEGLTKLGAYDDVLRVLDVLEGRFPRSIRPRQLRALALARRGRDGDLDRAQDLLGTLYQSGERDPETIGIYARTFKDRHAASGEPRFLRRARDLYAEGFQAAPDDYYVGINAATLCVLIGEPHDLKRAGEIASQVQELVGTDPVPGDYWKTATIGEVFLIRRDYANAARLYQAAIDAAPAEVGSHATTRKQALLLMERLCPSGAERARVLAPYAHLDPAAGTPDGSSAEKSPRAQ